MIGFIYAIIATIGYSVNNTINKKLVQNTNSWNALLLSSFFLSIFSALLVLVFSSFKQILSFEIFIYTFFGGLLGMLALIFLFDSFKHFNFGETMTIANLFPFFTLFFIFIFYGVKLSFSYFLVMFIVFLGIALIFRKSGEFKFNKFIYLPLLTAICWGFYHFSIKALINLNVEIFNIVFYLETSIFLFTLVYVLTNSKIKIEKSFLKRNNVLLGFFSGLSTTIGTLFVTFAMTKLLAPIVSSIISSQVMLLSLFGYLFYNEKLNNFQVLGIIVVFVGLVLFNFI